MRIIRGETWADIDRLEVEADGRRYLFTATKEGEGQEVHPRLSIEELGLDVVDHPGPRGSILEWVRGVNSAPLEAPPLVDEPGSSTCEWCGRALPEDKVVFHPRGILTDAAWICRPGFGCNMERGVRA